MGNVFNRTAQPPSESGLAGWSSLTQQPTDIKQVNDSVFELCSTQGVPQLEVVFFHGLQLSNYKKAFWKTWLSRDETVVWPKDWLNDSLRKKGIQARILSISYDSSARHHDRAPDSYAVVENLIHDMIFEASIGQNCPVILVGHSLGGIIIKRVLLECLRAKGLWRNSEKAHDRLARVQNFLDNCRGVFYYSTPHAGSRLADYMARIPFQQFNKSLITVLKTLSKETARNNKDFSDSWGDISGGKLKTQAVGEGLDTTYMFLKARVVEETSASLGVDKFYTAKNADHIQVCKPRNRNDPIFSKLEQFVNDVLEDEMNAAHFLEAEITMGNVASQSPSESPLTGQPPLLLQCAGIKKLNDSVWELCSTQGVPQVEVVFFHGLQFSNYEEDFWKTWLSRDGAELWPNWLSRLSDARILLISYNSCARHHDTNQDLYEIVENLIEDMIHHAVIGQNCPVILVGHCLGGIIIKQVLLRCVKEKDLWRNRVTTPRKVARLQNFLDNCKGVFYYSTPQAGSRLVDDAARIRSQQFNDSLITLLKTLSLETARMNEDFSIAKGNFGGGYLKTCAVGESLDTTFMGLTGRVVEEESARRFVDKFYTAFHSDHNQVCKARNHRDVIFTALERFVYDVLRGT